MVKYKSILLLLINFSLINCQHLYKLEKNKNGDPILNDKAKFSFNGMPTSEDLKKIDTINYYKQIFEGRYYNEDERKNPQIIFFHNDGYFKHGLLLSIDRLNLLKNKKSYYYGKYKITKDKIFLEEFYPSTGGSTKYYFKKIDEGIIKGDRIIFNNNDLVTIFEKHSKILEK